MRGLTARGRQRIREALDAGPLGEGALAFVEAVVLQTAHPLGGAPGEGGDEVATIDRVMALLEGAAGDDRSITAAAGELASDAALLSAFFQNLDLLPPSGSSPGDAVALLVVMALSRLEENSEGQWRPM